MTFNETHVYTALNADKLNPGDRVFTAHTIGALKCLVLENNPAKIGVIEKINDDLEENRFAVENRGSFSLAYLLKRVEPLKWSDLEVGDVIQNKDTEASYMVTGIEPKNDIDGHVWIGRFISDEELSDWIKCKSK